MNVKNKMEKIYALTPMQEGMLYHYNVDSHDKSYHTQAAFWIHEDIDGSIMRQALDILSFKHEALRTLFAIPKTSGAPKQVVVENKPIEFIEMHADSEIEAETIDKVIQDDLSRGFDLQKDSLVRLINVKCSSSRDLLILSSHHIIIDGWSLSIVLGDLLRYYKMLKDGESVEKTTSVARKEKSESGSYGEYIKWVNDQDNENSMTYWDELLSDYEHVAEIRSTEKPEPTKLQAVTETLSFGVELSDALVNLASNNDVTMSVVAEAAWGVVLQKFNFVDDVVFGKVVSGRNVPINGIEKTIGLFINTIPCRVKCYENTKVSELLQSIKDQGIDGYSHDYCSLADIQRRSVQGNNLVKTLFLFQNHYVDSSNLVDDIDIQQSDSLSREQTNYPLTARSYMSDGVLHFRILYNPSEYTKRSIELILSKIQSVFESFVANPEGIIQEMELLSEAERELILNVFNDTSMDYPCDRTVVELFEEQVSKNLDNVALVYEDESLTYRELNERSNAVAYKLRDLGVKPDDFVGIVAERSIEVIVGIFGIIKSGGAYVPIDSTYPSNRIHYMLDDCSPKAVLVYGVEFETSIPTIDLGSADTYEGDTSNPVHINKPEDLVYCIYTSGTTGNPKGVMIENKGVISLQKFLASLYNIADSDCVLQFANYVFDASVWEIVLSLLSGAKLCIVSVRDINDTLRFEEYVKANGVTLCVLPPQYYMQTNVNGLKALTTAGSDANVDMVRKALKNNERYINAYGPTENTIQATHWEMNIAESITSTIPIGRPISNTQLYIMSGDQLCGIGIPGELCIAGAGLARGYLNQPELTLEKFVKNPFGEGRLYRSGDLARWLPDGNIEFMGRIDEQVKIRGYRIELGEIESVLRRQIAVSDAAVIVRENSDGEKYICGYVVSSENMDIEKLKNGLRQNLPEYMVPLAIMQIDSIPMTRNGKLDRKALPAIEAANGHKYVAPRTATEEAIAEAFGEVLGLERVGVNDNFFELGGHSLSAMRLVNRIESLTGSRIALQEIFTNTTIEGIAQLVEAGVKTEFEPIPAVEHRDSYAMSSTQKRIYIINELDRGNITYNMPAGIEIKGKLDLSRIEAAYRDLIKRHEALRTSFHTDSTSNDGNDELIQRIHDEVEDTFSYEEAIGEVDRAQLLDEFVAPFDLTCAPLMRLKVVKCGDEEHIILFDMHHIISDGMSMNLLQSELSSLYVGENLDELRVHYKDYSEWMRGRDLSSQESYWISEFSDEVPVLDLPLDYARPRTQSFKGRSIFSSIGSNLRSRIRDLSMSTGTSEYMVFLSSIMILLSKYSNQNDIVIGSPVLGRTHKDTESMLGMFVNTLAMRGRPVDSKSYIEFLQELKDTCFKGFENQEYPFEELIESVEVRRDLSRNPLFDVVFAMQNNEDIGLKFGDADVGDISSNTSVAKFDLTFNVAESEDGGYAFAAEYCSDLFKESTVEQMVDRLLLVLEEIVENPEAKISDISITTEAERELILDVFNDTSTDFPRDKTVIELFEEHVNKSPDSVALVYEDQSLTYRELNDRSNAVAHKLRGLGVCSDDFVSIVAERSIEVIVGIFGIIKSGGAYVPIDSTCPLDRIHYMLDDCNPKAVLLYGVELETTIPTIDLGSANMFEGDTSNPVHINKPEDLVYCIYTSGTTGNPKGVMIEHRNVAHLVKNTNYISFDEEIVVLQTGVLSFDASVFEIFGALLNGGRLCLLGDGVLLDTKELKKSIQRNSVNTFFLTTALFNQMVDADISMFDGLKYALFGGEQASDEHVYRLAKQNTVMHLVNGYGPTETTTFSNYYEVEGDRIGSKLPIGRPISNTKVYVMSGGNLCGIGIPGELCIAGSGVARGYLNQPGLTSEKFVDNPYGDGKLYRTGDLARWLPDGNIEFMGRIDEQVKVRGYRIELGEIGSVLNTLEGIQDSAVIVREDHSGGKSICAYIVSEEDIDASTLRSALSEKLPDYMIPTYIARIDSIPLTTNGKLDRKTLPAIEVKSGQEYVAPKTTVEKAIAEAFEDILGLERVGVHDSFFEIGGDSIKAIRIVSRLRNSDIEVSLKEIMDGKTVEAVALVAKTGVNEMVYEQGEITGKVEKTQIIEAFDEWNLQKPWHFNQATMFDVGATGSEDIKIALSALSTHHDILRAVYRENTLEILGIDESKLFDYYEYDFTDLSDASSAVEKECSMIQASINLEEGPLVKAALFTLKEGRILMLCIHHLVVDGVSWRILHEDFNIALKQSATGEKIKLPRKTASFKEWATSINIHGKEIGQKDGYYWEEVNSQIENGKVHCDYAENTAPSEDAYVKTSVQFSKEVTEGLLKQANVAYGTKIDELLLSGLAMAIEKITGQERLAVMLEGHGRYGQNKLVAVDRTVGWFTSMYPVILDCHRGMRRSVVGVKETLRGVLNGGLGYSYADIAPRVEPDVFFNYLGDIGNIDDVEALGHNYSIGETVAEENRLPGAININGMAEGGVLSFEISCESRRFGTLFAETLANEFKSCVDAVVEHCSKTTVERTASDYGLYGMQMLEFDKLRKSISGEVEKIYSLTPLQEGMLFHKMMNSDSTSYVVQKSYDIRGKVTPGLFDETLKLLVKRYEVLRTSIIYKGINEPKQAIMKDRVPEYNLVDLSHCRGDEFSRKYAAIKTEDLERGFDLQDESLVRATCVKIDESHYKLLLNFHHIILDAWCIELIVDKFMEYYKQLAMGVDSEDISKQILEEKAGKSEYSDYIISLENRTKTVAMQYWEKLLDGYEGTGDIKAMVRPEPSSKQVKTATQTLDKRLSSKLVQTATETSVTLSTIVETACGILIQKYNWSNDVVFGKVVSGRNAEIKGVDEIVGLFVNTIPVRVVTDSELTIRELLQRQQEQWTASNNYDFCPLSEIQNGADIVKVLFEYQNLELGNKSSVEEESVKHIDFTLEDAREQTNYALSISAHIADEILHYKIMYNPNEFGDKEIEVILKRLATIIEEIVKETDKPVCMIEGVPEEEKHLVFAQFNDTESEYPSEKSMVQLLEEQVERVPDNVAIVYDDNELTYRELNEKANVIAHKLRSMGVKEDDFVAIVAERGVELIVGIYGIIKAGGAYVPIDPTSPKNRMHFMFEDCNAKAVLTYNVKIETKYPTLDLGKPETWEGSTENPQRICKPENLLYCIYTSGTTGAPKGVMVEHRNAVYLKSFFEEALAITQEDRILQFANSTFDASVLEIFMAFLTGARLVCATTELINAPEHLSLFCKAHGVTAAIFPPNYYVQEGIDVELRVLITGGSASNMAVLQKAGDHGYYNGYGPTEATVCASYWKKPIGWEGDNIPIGRPNPNAQIYILQNMNLCGIGMIGELCIAGVGIVRGYLNQPKLTEEKFIENPYGEGRLYRTGDLARWLPDGNIEFLGRADEQVKVSGHRIELGEIDAVIREIPYVNDCAVVAFDDSSGENVIFAYIVSNIEIDEYDVRSILLKTLPNYMVPAYIIQIDAIPLTRSGKCDKKALPKIVDTSEREYVAPRTDLEDKICRIFSEYIDVDRIGITDKYFSFGLSSIKLMKILSTLNSFGIIIPFQSVYNNETIKDLVDSLSNNSNNLIIDNIEHYKRYDNMLAGNVWSKDTEIQKRELGTVIITGANGFLAMHVLDEIVKGGRYEKIFCFVRATNEDMAYNKIEESLNYYFDGEHVSLLKKEVHVVPVDIVDADFVEECTNIRPDTIFHIAANTKHYGFFNDFYSANVEGTKNICMLAELTGAFLVHISTLGICPYFNSDLEDKSFSERDYYKGQEFDNVYATTKFLAEGVVFEHLLKNKGIIIRTGAIQGRHRDAKETMSFEHNRILNHLQTIVQLRSIPRSFLSESMQIDTVDNIAEGVVVLAENYATNANVFHLVNEDKISISEIIAAFDQCGYKIDIHDDATELDKVYGENVEKFYDLLVVSINNEHYPAEVKNEFTKHFISALGYEVHKVDIEYMVRLIKSLDEYGFWRV
ncbi:MAG: amino acid adenylation domain-containing protein [Oscillospiraceae bacterium]|nr:amino acid adenylation domain-containing protein [Oscillospiraceae bacterium]